MPLINLIHEQRLVVRKRDHQVRLAVVTTIGLSALSFLAAGYFLFNAARFQVMSTVLEAKKQKLQPLLQQLEGNERDRLVMEPKLTTLTSATKSTEQWCRIMDHLTVNVPKNVWLNNIRCAQATGSDSGTNLTFQGNSVNHDEAGEFLLRLEACPDLEAVTLKFIQEKQSDKERVLEFEISAFVAGSRETKKIREKEES
ncbi:MAG: PilN domain-containing protein [Armatimonadetes bacterium]|nr:PilN domain-containing protein [Armatimonadota bacterium]